MVNCHIPENLDINEYTYKWRERNSLKLQKALLRIKAIEDKNPGYTGSNALLFANFLVNLTKTAKAISILSFKHLEAEIITLSGTMIEGMALMLYCLKNNKADVYFDYLTINGLSLEYGEAEAGAALNSNQVEFYINMLKKLGHKYIKADKNYTEVIEFLKSEENSYADKIKVLKDSYKKFPKHSVKYLVKEYTNQDIEKAVYEKYCHIKHHHLNNNVWYHEQKRWDKIFCPFDELNGISSALDILNKLIDKYDEMKKDGIITEP
ncbi:MAG: hypothetical protein LBL47_04735 [Lactobacillus sp.]|jgi:hypothetical protein|nr:hypothetical protein [Lactobacillus sp.]